MNAVHPLPAPLSRFRLPPQPGQLEQIMDKAMRAWQRRCRLMADQGATLNALRVMDTQLEQCVVALSLDLAGADRLLLARIDEARAQGAGELAEWVFLRCALAIQCRPAELPRWLDAELLEHPDEVRDALLFYPVPSSLLPERNDHILPFIKRQPSDCFPLWVELIGRRTLHERRGTLLQAQQAQPLAAPVHLALLRLGIFNDASEAFVRHALAHGSAPLQVQALQLVGMSGRRRLYRWGEGLLQSTHPPLQDLAWALHALDQPRRAVETALAWGIAPAGAGQAKAGAGRLPESIGWRVLALGGHLAGLMAACRCITAQAGPVTGLQRDLLRLTLGQIPPALLQKPKLAEPKQQALRELMLQALRRAFVPLQNSADTAPWSLAAWASDPGRAAELRLREGRPQGVSSQPAALAAFPAFPAVLPELSQALRQWLYFERAHATQQPFAVDAADLARHQDDAAMLVELVCELNAGGASTAPH